MPTTVTAKVVPVLNRTPATPDEAVELVGEDGLTPLRMILYANGFQPGQAVRIQVVDTPEDEEPDPFLQP